MQMQGQGAYRSAEACARCGAGIDTTQAAYAAEGMICRGCEAQESLRDAQTMSSQSAGLGALGWGIVSLFCNVLFIPSILAITSGVKDLKALKMPDARETFGSEYGNIQAKAIIGIVLASLHPLAIVGLVCLAVLGGVIGALSGPSYDSYDPYYDTGYYDTGYYGSDPAYDPYGHGSDPLYDDSYGNAYDDDGYGGGYGAGGLGGAGTGTGTGTGYGAGSGGLGNTYDDPYR